MWVPSYLQAWYWITSSDDFVTVDMRIFKIVPHAAWFFLTLSLFQSPVVAGADEQVWIPGWRSGPALSMARTGHAALMIQDRLYLIGGTNKEHYIRRIEQSRIAPDGSLSAWQYAEHELNVGRAYHGVVHIGRYIYAIGGSSTNVKGLLDSVERAEVNPDGSIGAWQLEKGRLNIARRCVHVVHINGYLYAVGGFGGKLLDSIERAKIGADGSLGEWEMLSDMMQYARYVHAAKSVGDRLYVLGGHDKSAGVGIASVEWAQQDEEGMFTPWQTTVPMHKNRYGLGAAMHEGYLYAMGGIDGQMHLASIEKARLREDGAITDWQQTTALPAARAAFGSVVYRDALYILGGSVGEELTDEVAFAFFNSQGDLGYWGRPEEAERVRRAAADRLQQLQQSYPNRVKVVEYLPAGQFNLLQVERSDGMQAWLVVPPGVYAKGMMIRFANGNLYPNYYNPTLKRRFQVVMFVKDLIPVEVFK